MSSIYHGNTGKLMIAPNGNDAAVAVASLTDWSLDLSRDKVEVTALQDTNKSFIQGLPNYSGSFSGFWNVSEDTLFDAQASTAAVRMYIYPSTTLATKYFYGTAWLSLTINGAVGDAIKLSGTFSPAGAWASNGF